MRGEAVEPGDTGSHCDDEAGPTRDGSPAWFDHVRSVGVLRTVVAIAVLAVLARLVFLGARTAHYDEARVAYWTLHTIETGDFAYRRIIHGPVVQHANHVLVPLLGASDFVVRLPVALVGGLLPLSALLFREHLDDDEQVVLALFLAFSPVLVYYSRFMRSDVLVAAFMFTALGTLVRFYDTRRPRYLYAAAVLIALGIGSKENAVVYLLTWLGAGALLVDQALYRPRNRESGFSRLAARSRGLRSWRPADGTRGRSIGRWIAHGLAAGAVFLAVTIVVFGPRGAGMDGLYYPPPADGVGLGLWEALTRPLAFPGYAVDTLTHAGGEYWEWIAQSSEPKCGDDTIVGGWPCFLEQYVSVMVNYAGVLSAFAVGGFLYERYAKPVTRNLVMFTAYGGFVSVLGYPLGADIFGAWIVTHALVPLAVPAAVGVARLYRWGVDAVEDRDGVGTAAAAVALVALVVLVAAGNVGAVYTNDTADGNDLVQYAQPADDLDPVIDAMAASVADGREGPDVLLYYGATGDERIDREALVKTDPGWGDGDLLTRPACAEWFNSLPLPWYYETTDATVDCAGDLAELASKSGPDGPGVVITMVSDGSVPVSDLEAAGYTAETYRLRTTDKEMRVFVHERVDGA